VKPLTDLDSVVQDLASSPVTIIEYVVPVKLELNVTVALLGLPVNEPPLTNPDLDVNPPPVPVTPDHLTPDAVETNDCPVVPVLLLLSYR
jgi:hypothetical protein